MKIAGKLPEGYRQIYSIDLQKNTKMMLLVNALAILIAALMAVPMHYIVPITTLFDMTGGIEAYTTRFAVLIGLLILYMVLHELVHGIAMMICGTKKVKYGFTGMYAYACSDDYYTKKPYLFIALAPVVLWGIVLAVINPFVPTAWFWVIYMIQITNLSGAAGDFLVTVKFIRMPEDILVKDHGVGMVVYSHSREES